ncbi:transcription antiterminator BglG [Floricoccus tropicus]|uniref:Transcription antiterminator BglG n=2 Tax=Floricoccus tropicus TaxID=1859473 RepID=A0A1E8GN68_9LACT|nr:transcription antiterminator BglG [Floricoccus tropicus]
MKGKEKELLQLLIKAHGDFLTSKYLASHMSISDRTVRSYLSNIKELLSKNGADIESKQGKGYSLVINDRLLFDKFLNKVDHRMNFSMIDTDYSEASERQKFILNRLLLEDEVIILDKLSKEMFFSKSTLNKDINEIKEIIEPYNLKLAKKSKKEIYIEGKERNKRHFILEYFFGNSYLDTVKKYIDFNNFFNQISFQELTIIILDECRQEKIKLSDYIIQNLVLHLSLSIKRILVGSEIKDLGIDLDINNSTEYEVAKRIIKRIEESINIKFPKEEVAYLALHLMSKSSISGYKSCDILEAELDQALEVMEEETGYPLSSDINLKNGLLDHIRPMLVRLERNIVQDNPLLSEIVKNYQATFELTKKRLGEISSLRKYTINDGEWAYLTLHLMAAIEKYKENQKIKTLIICATGYGSAQLLKTRVEKEFSNYLTIVDVLGYYEICEESLRDAELIISSISLSSMVFKVPVVHVSVFLNSEDTYSIRNIISSLNNKDKKIMLENNSNAERNEQIFDSQLSKEMFEIFEGENISKKCILDELLAKASQSEREDYKERMIEQINQRESMGQILFSETVAVPHPVLPVGMTTKVAIGVIPKGFSWNDEYANVKFVFLISPSYIENENLISITKAIVKLVESENLQNDILQDITFEHFRNNFLRLID